MKRLLILLVIFCSVFFVYFAVGTDFTFKPKWAIDYFNPMAQSLLHFRLDIKNPVETHDLIQFQGKWYIPWGILPAIFLIPLQVLQGRFVPAFYLSLLFSSLTTVVVLLLLKRVQKEFFPIFSNVSLCIVLILFAFGTTQFYVGTLGSVWHVNQIVSSFFGTLGIFFIFKKKPIPIDYFISLLCFGIGFLGRPTMLFLVSLPISLYVFHILENGKSTLENKTKYVKQAIILFGIPLFVFCSIFFLYNYVRFGNVFQTGYDYIHESYNLEQIRKTNGISSFKNIPKNAHYLLFEFPKVIFAKNNLSFNFNLYGNSIFFLTPPFLVIFLSKAIRREKGKLKINRFIASLWIAVISTAIPILMHYSSGWMQFGYRYSLDIAVLLLLLSVFGIRGKMNILYIVGVIFAVWIHLLGIFSLM